MTNKDIQKIINKGSEIYFEDGFSVFNGHKNISLGSNIYLVDTLINAGDSDGSVRIEDDVFFGHGVKILARGHDYKLYGRQRQTTVNERPIHIKNGSWVGSGSIILGGITLGEDCVVGAGSIVTKDVPSKGIVVGNPAKLIKYIDRELTILEKLWRYFR